MVQVHTWLTDEQVKPLLQGYCQRVLSRDDMQDLVAIGRSCFFVLLSADRADSDTFSHWMGSGSTYELKASHEESTFQLL